MSISSAPPQAPRNLTGMTGKWVVRWGRWWFSDQVGGWGKYVSKKN